MCFQLYNCLWQCFRILFFKCQHCHVKSSSLVLHLLSFFSHWILFCSLLIMINLMMLAVSTFLHCFHTTWWELCCLYNCTCWTHNLINSVIVVVSKHIVVVLHICKAYNANFACYENLTRSYKCNLVYFLFSDLLSCHQLSKYLSLDTLSNKLAITLIKKFYFLFYHYC
jgi:hypothetical protein